MRLTHLLLSGTLLLSMVAPSWGQYRLRNYRPSRYYPQQPMQQQSYSPPMGGYGYYPPADAYYPVPQQQTDGRHLWIYGSQGEGSFQQQPDGTWVESNNTGQFYFREIARTPTYIDLFDPSRLASARLTNQIMYHHGPGDPMWHFGYYGQWQ